MSNRITTLTLLKYKQEGKKIVCLAAYDYSTAKTLDELVEVIVVGDSLGVLALGQKTGSEVTVEEMLHHTRAVARGASRALVVADMPFMSYQVDVSQALANAGSFVKDAGADAVKLEGSSEHDLEVVRRLVAMGIPVMGHIGCVPNPEMGGARCQVTTAQEAEKLLDAALTLQAAGIFSLALEMVPPPVAKIISQRLRVPTIGYGSGSDCDGQTFKSDNLFNKFGSVQPIFGRSYADLSAICREAVASYAKDVANQTFPSANASSSFSREQEEELEKLLAKKWLKQEVPQRPMTHSGV